jgi:hypothetical protein
VRFVDFLKTTVLACAGAATALGALAVLRAAADGDTGLVGFALGWWALAGVVGAWLGRGRDPLPAIGRLLAGARTSASLPDQEQPIRILVNRLWPLAVVLVVSAGLAWRFPQVPAIAAGFTVIWALYWRRQDGAVTAIEERDGVGFYVERTSPLQPIQLVRTPGFRRIAPPESLVSGNGLG